jgi:signal transduction histidine kinase
MPLTSKRRAAADVPNPLPHDVPGSPGSQDLSGAGGLPSAQVVQQAGAPERRVSTPGGAQFGVLARTITEAVVLHELICDREGRPTDYLVLDFNPACESILGIPRPEAIGRPASLVYGTGEPPFLDICARAAQTGLPTVFETNLDPPGKSLRVSVLPAEAGCFVTVFEDLTERRRLEEQFKQAQRLEALGRMAGDVAHDLNNLLLAIRGYSELMLEQLARGSVLRPDAEQILRASDRAVMLTRELLACSRKQAAELVLVNLNELLMGSVKMLRRVLGRNVELVVLPASRIELVKADPGRLDQVIMNLAVNARDAMPHGGRLTIETASLAIAKPEFAGPAVIPPGAYVLLSASDTGTGMTAEVQARIFEPFFTTKEHGKGTGLGLSTVYSIVKQCGGYIRVESAPQKGSRFEILLPAVAEA